MSENHQLFKVIDTVSFFIGNKGIYAIDRGGDRGKLYDKFLKEKENGLSSVLRKERDLIHKGTRKNCHDLAVALPCPHEAVIIKYEEGKERKVSIIFSSLTGLAFIIFRG